MKSFQGDIVARVKKHYDNCTSGILLLSQLGLELVQEGYDLTQESSPLKFSQFVASIPELDTRRNEEIHQQIAVFPSGHFTADEKIFDSVKKSKKRINFRKDFWDAFFEPLAPDRTKRWLNIDPETATFVHDGPPEPEGASWLEIPTHLLNSTGEFVAPAVIEYKLEQFAKACGIEIEVLAAPSNLADSSIGEEPVIRDRSSLEVFLSELSDDQRKSLNIRADIIHNMLK